MAEPSGTEKRPIDPFIANLSQSIGMVLDPAGMEAPKADAAGSPTVSEILTRAKAKEGEPPKGGEADTGSTKSDPPNPKHQEEKKEAQASAGGGEGGEGGQAAAGADAGAAGTAHPGTAFDGVVSPEAFELERENQTARNEAPPAQAEGENPPDPELLARLTPEELEEYELARYAEVVAVEKHKGLAAKTLEYFKQVAEWTQANPDASEDDFNEFITKIKPQWEAGERRRLEIRKVKDETETRMRAEMEERIRQSELKPVVQRQVEGFRERLLAQKLPDNLDQLNPLVAADVKAFLAKPSKEAYAELREKHPLEAPTLVETALAAEAFLRITHGLDSFNPKNSRHQFLASFIAKQGEILEKSPEEKRIRNGKEFLSRHKHAELFQRNPAEAAKYWTFDDGEVADMLAVNAAMGVAKKYQVSGLVRKGADAGTAKPATPPPSTPPASAANPPKAGASIAPGAAKGGTAVDPDIARFFTALGPTVAAMVQPK